MKNLTLPDMSEDLAEFTGIHFGDGSLYKDNRHNYRVYYSFNLSKDLKFSKYFLNLFHKLFHVKLHIYLRPNRNSLELGIRRKVLYFFLKDKLNFPSGKKNTLSIPIYIKKKKLYLICFLRGLFDTDGCVIFQNRKYLRIKICTKDMHFAKEIKSSLASLNIQSYICKKSSLRNGTPCIGFDIVISGKNAKMFNDTIGSKNYRNQIKYKKSGIAGI